MGLLTEGGKDEGEEGYSQRHKDIRGALGEVGKLRQPVSHGEGERKYC